jgi:ELL-associated factor
MNGHGGGGTASEKLGLSNDVRELKFGPSFSGNGKGGSFHTVRYDFKPASVDSTKMATLDVGPNNQVTISIPHSDGVSTNVFKGARKPYTKECVLIVDHVTGEVVLEKLTHTIQVKKTRPERPEGSTRGGPQKPVAPSEVKKPQPSPLATSQGPSSSNPSSDRPISKPAKDTSKIKKLMSIGNNSHSPSNANSYGHRGSNSPMMSVPARHSPLGPSPGHISPGNGNGHHNSSASVAFDNLSKKHHKPTAPVPPPVPSAMPSLPCIEDLLSFNAPPPPPTQPQPPPPPPPSFAKNLTPTPIQKQFHHTRTPTMIVTPPPAPPPPPSRSPVTHVAASGGLSDSSASSGDSSSSSSSSSDASDDDSSDEEMEEVVPDHGGSISGHAPAPSMPSVFDTMPVPMGRSIMTKPLPSASHLLSEDLQLSESGSDSD